MSDATVTVTMLYVVCPGLGPVWSGVVWCDVVCRIGIGTRQEECRLSDVGGHYRRMNYTKRTRSYLGKKNSIDDEDESTGCSQGPVRLVGSKVRLLDCGATGIGDVIGGVSL